MKLTDFTGNLVIDDAKITHYLLDEKHNEGGPKARFLKLFGFSEDEPQKLKSSLLDHAIDGEVTDVEHTVFGDVYTVYGALPTPDGRHPLLHTVWQIDDGEKAARLITLIPKEEKQQ